jgi:hypothetical protein
MSTPSESDRIEIWRLTYACSSLHEARGAAKYLLANRNLAWDSKKAFLTQLVIAYARPFTKCQLTASIRAAPLAEGLVPHQFIDLHREHWEMRNRAVGHKDATAFPSRPLNKVLLHVDDDGSLELTTTSVYDLSDDALRRTIDLCELLVRHCASELQKYMLHFAGMPPGEYLMSTESAPVAWLERQT